MNRSRRSVLPLLSLPVVASGCAEVSHRYFGAYSRFREPPGEEWSYVSASTAIERLSPIRVTTSAYGGSMVGTKDNFMLKTDISMISRRALNINTQELALVVGTQPLPPGKYALDHIGFYANAWQAWSIAGFIAPPYLNVPARSVLYVGSYIATQSGAMRVSNQDARDIPIAMAKDPKLRTLPLVREVPETSNSSFQSKAYGRA